MVIRCKPSSRIQSEANLNDTSVTTAVYFFCSTTYSGTEGIKQVTNFVAFLALHRGFLCSDLCSVTAATYYGCVPQMVKARAACKSTTFCGRRFDYADYGSFYIPLFNIPAPLLPL